jgi:hypothetical protein
LFAIQDPELGPRNHLIRQLFGNCPKNAACAGLWLFLPSFVT